MRYARVSHLQAFREYMADEEAELAPFLRRIAPDSPASELMLAGTAFHKAMEFMPVGEFNTAKALGFTFHLPDCELHLPRVRELRIAKAYGDLMVSGCVDAIYGTRIDDHKTTGHFQPERYLDGYQWRFYLDIFGCDRFRWNVFEMKEVAIRTYQVQPPQILEMCRYPGMHNDCARVAEQFYQHMEQINA